MLHTRSPVGRFADARRPSQPADPRPADPPGRLRLGRRDDLAKPDRPDRRRGLRAEVVQVVASKSGIGAIARAEAAGIPVAVEVRDKRPLAEFSAAIFDPIRRRGADLVILGGFLSLVQIPPDYVGRVINIHPSLIPAFSGKGFHGERPQGRDRRRASRSPAAPSISPTTPMTPARSSSRVLCPSSTTTPPRPSPPGSSRPSVRLCRRPSIYMPRES